MRDKDIIPTVFATDKKGFDTKVKLLTPFSKKLHIDFMDGQFVKSKSIHIKEMKILNDYPTIEFSIHMMAKDPDKYLDEIKTLPITRVLLQLETLKTKKTVEKNLNEFNHADLDVGLVLNPETKVKEILPYLEMINCVLVMGVHPGKEKQEFIYETLNKIRELREYDAGIEILVDGGVKEDNAMNIIEAGADILCVGSQISSDKNPKKRYEEMLEMVKDK